jgi:hypothetical protein
LIQAKVKVEAMVVTPRKKVEVAPKVNLDVNAS